MKIRPLSFSRLNLFRHCLYAAKRKYIDGDPEPAIANADVMVVGKAAHRVFAQRNVDCISSGKQTIINGAVDHARSLSNELDDANYSDLMDICETFDKYHLLENPKNSFVELMLAVDNKGNVISYDDPDAFVRGRIDLVSIDKDNFATITDFKTNHRPLPQGEIDDSYQLEIYALLIKAQFPDVLAIDAGMEFVRYGFRVSRTIELDTIDETLLRLKADQRQLESKTKFPATPNSWCGSCKYLRKCPAFIMRDEMPAVRNITTARDAAKKIFIMQEFMTDTKKQLKEWVDSNGGITVNDMKLDHHVSDSIKYSDAEHLTIELTDLGLLVDDTDYNNLVTVTKTSLDKVLKKGINDEVITVEQATELREKYGEDTHSSQFKFKKVNGTS